MTTTPDYGAQIVAAKDAGLGLLSDNVLYLFALPVAWVGFKVGRKIVNKIG